MYAEVNLKLRQSKSALTVPLNAVDESGDSAQLFVVRDSRIHVVPVEVGIKNAQRQEILSGVAAGEMVVVGRHAGLQEGQAVTPKTAQFEQVAALQTGN
jgi:multidrug efflux pump subunit AcrA (membrane-fusion protein)